MHAYAGSNMILKRTEMSCSRTKMRPNQITRTVATGNKISSIWRRARPLQPLTLTMMDILEKWNYYGTTFVYIFLLRWNFYPTTNDFNMLYFDICTNVNTKELMQCQLGTDTSTMVGNHGLLEMRCDSRWLGESVSTGGLLEPAMNASDTDNVIPNHYKK